MIEAPPGGDAFAHGLDSQGSQGPVISVGGALDMSAGHTRPAPQSMHTIEAEWLPRLAQEPRRLTWRCVVDCPWALVRHVLPSMLRGRLHLGEHARR